jgi:hypothetical protein
MLARQIGSLGIGFVSGLGAGTRQKVASALGRAAVLGNRGLLQAYYTCGDPGRGYAETHQGKIWSVERCDSAMAAER